MTWSLARARQAAAHVRAAQLGAQAVATMRPRGVFGFARECAPLPLLLFIAARDGLVVEQDTGGYAVLQRPAADPPLRSGGYGLRFLRWLDRRWDFLLLFGPLCLGVLVATVTAPFPALRVVSIVVVIADLLWLGLLPTASLVNLFRLLAGIGAPRRGRAAKSLPAYHWSVPLVHQPNPDQIDDLMRRLTERLVDLIQADLQASAGDKARVGRPEVTETLVVLTSGISTEAARTAMAKSLRTIQNYPPGGGVIVLASPSRLERSPMRPVSGGGFLLLCLMWIAVEIAISVRPVADTEATACAPASCAGRPATYSSALRWLLQRLLLFSDPPGLAPGTARVVVLGWLVSLSAAAFVFAAFVAGREELARNRQQSAQHDEAISGITGTARVLIIAVTAEEREAVLAAVRQHVGRAAVIDHTGACTTYALGSISGTELMLAQAGEQGTAATAGMLIAVREAIGQCRPDYVILTGICYGLRPDEGQQTGDIVVARRVQNVGHRKVTDHHVIDRGSNVGCSPVLLDRFQAGQSTWSGARVHIGTVLTSNSVVNSKQLVCRLREQFPDAIAGEKEGTGVYEASLSLDVKPDWIMVKAISDLGYDKINNGQSLAARNAAEFITHVIAAGALRRQRNRSTR